MAELWLLCELFFFIWFSILEMSGPALSSSAAFVENLPDNIICIQTSWYTFLIILKDWQNGIQRWAPTQLSQTCFTCTWCLSQGLTWNRGARCVCKHSIALQTGIQTAFILWIWLLTSLWPCQHMLHISAVDYGGPEASFAIIVPVESKSVIFMGFISFSVCSNISLRLWKIHLQDLHKSLWPFQTLRAKQNPYLCLRRFPSEHPPAFLLGATDSFA